ncbi:MAG: TlpA family protein disulfide reductase [Planctomycetia bacterium]|nr:TlpA family protein disulfide reductase [Planctomycetia bacterium]
MRSSLVLSVVLLLVGITGARADDTAQYNEIRQLLSSGKLDEAEKSFASAIEASPDSARLKSLHYLLYIYFNRAGRTLDAARHAEANVDVWLENLARSPQVASSFTGQVDSVTSAYAALNQHDVAMQKLDDIVHKVGKLLAVNKSPEVAALAVELRAAGAGKNDEGRVLLDSVRKEAEAALAANPADTSAALAVANVLAVNADFESAGEAADAARKEHLDFLAEQAKAHPSNRTLVSTYLNAETLALSGLLRSDAIQAERELASLREFLASLDRDNPQIQALIQSSERGLSSLAGRIAAAKAQQALVGQPAFPLDVEAWVNGDEITEKELEGKVVLIDFWAVWCGPCIATFPHLREWHDEYSDKGLVIIGATRYYSYDWDDATDRIKKVEGLTEEDERAALVRFAQHHELKHRFMVMPKESEFSKKYGVTGIPQAVLIGRDGKVRMIRVGSGEANARDLEAKIEELLAASN